MKASEKFSTELYMLTPIGKIKQSYVQMYTNITCHFSIVYIHHPDLPDVHPLGNLLGFWEDEIKGFPDNYINKWAAIGPKVINMV